jgi:hypothetical protein
MEPDMGMFTKNTMSIDEMAVLVSYVVLMIIAYHHKYGAWPQGDRKAEFAARWLEKNNHKASHWKLSKLSVLADNIARMLVAKIEDIMSILDHEAFQEDLLVLSRNALLREDITS